MDRIFTKKLTFIHTLDIRKWGARKIQVLFFVVF